MKIPATSFQSLTWMLAGLISIGPLAIDAYLPAMPQIATSLDTSIHHVELTLSVFLIGFALGQLFGGPFSDQYGRRLTILSGLGIFALGSLLAALTPSIEILWLARVLQAFGGGIGVVNTMAVVRDLYSGRDSARALSRIVSIMLAAPLLAPFIGSGILLFSNWRGIFALLMLYALALLLVLLRTLPETRQASVQVSMHPLRRYWSVIRHRPTLGFLSATAFSHAGMFAFITGSALVYMEYYGASPQLFPVLFGMNILTLVACNRLNVLFLNHTSPLRLLKIGQAVQLLFGLVLLLSYLLFELPLWGLVLMIMLFMGQHGFIMANGISSAVDYFPQSAATASAVITATGFMVGAASGTLVGLLGDGSPIPMLAVMAACPMLGILLRTLLHRDLQIPPEQ
ncbi:multidrug effflux MFS transporter [Marinospirillum alkaliphilum]|uniref:Bcr/CflA family efflux transporter n=1 Tax=Marinospirillum alkaliphilum DSM 21637 TaxID=1122209 RepID=A0A1K1WLP7_9GAMM|nr:multidrug effflux MFS transporter [Marinospirillum alkaliphilum]SFX38207.1 MFS transporter, DHA1 family, bicyclomycin/chloramphenicol resistance protein [Marinospirillum alkaliphilum DSM 21637]